MALSERLEGIPRGGNLPDQCVAGDFLLSNAYTQRNKMRLVMFRLLAILDVYVVQ